MTIRERVSKLWRKDVKYLVKKRTVPNLPEDVIREIMLSATDTLPSPYSSHCRRPITSATYTPSLFHHDGGLAFAEIDLLRKSLKTKVALSKVSKLWRELSAEFLFNTIILDHIQQVPLLFRALDGDKMRREGNEGPGSWAFLVRRLWMNGSRTEEPLEIPSMLTMEDVVRRCPNIVTFRHISDAHSFKQPPPWNPLNVNQLTYRKIFRGTSKDDDGPCETLPPPSSGDLLELDLNVAHLSLQELIGEGPRHSTHVFRFIQVLKLHCHKNPDHSHKLFTAVEFPVLDFLQLSSTRWFSQATLFRMPSLRRLSLDPFKTSPYLGTQDGNKAQRDMLVKFLRRHGGRLEEITFLESVPWTLDLDALSPSLVRLNTVTSLQYVRYRVPALCVTAHANVTEVGLGRLDLDSMDWAIADQLFEPLFHAFPHLGIIQAMNWPASEIFSGAASCWSRPITPKPRKAFWIRTLELMDERGIRLLDWRGLPIRIRDT